MSKDTKQGGVKQVTYVQFARPIRGPGTGMIDSVSASPDLEVFSYGDFLHVRRSEFSAEVVVPWSNVLFAWVES